MSVIDVALTAFPLCSERVDYLEQTAGSLKRHLRATGHELHWVCASESARLDPAADARQRRLCASLGIDLVYQPPGAEPCLGRNLNTLRGRLRGEFSLYVQDDFVLEQELDLGESARLLRRHPEILMVHYYWEILTARPDAAPVAGEAGHYWLPNDLRYKYKDNPHLAARAFYERVGPYEERSEPGETEIDMDERVRRLEVPIVARLPVAFRHVGAVSARKLVKRDRAGSQSR
jgi:hypothetical protein